MKRNIFVVGVIIVIAIMVAVAAYIPGSLPVNSDFSAIYYTDLALVNGIHIYNIPEMEALALQVSGIPPENFFMPRFPYPPWYALSTFYLGLLSIQSAGTLWFELNLVMLFLSIWFLTDGWTGRLRLIAFPLGLFFLPVVGALSVGQYDFPVLLGTSLLVYALRNEDIALTTLGTVLATFKPHVGALVMLSVLVYLIGSRNSFGRRALRSILITGGLLFIIGFIADPAWVVNYPTMLLNYQGEGNVVSCSECASVPVYISRWLFDGSLEKAALIALALLILFIGAFALTRNLLLKSPALLIVSALLITLLVSPYLYNYDFILLLVPFTILMSTKNALQRVVVIICYLLPTFAIIMYGRAGNITLLMVTTTLALLVFLHAKSQVDVPAWSAYNTNN